MNDLMPLLLREFHQSCGARFMAVQGMEVIADFGDVSAERDALRESAGILDFSFRGRLCLVGADRARFLHGQVTNDVKKLRPGEGCYAALTTAKGKMQSDLNIFALQDELLLDFEPGLAEAVRQRLEKFIVADDVQVVDTAPHYGLLSVQGPKADAAVRALGLFPELPDKPLASCKVSDAMFGDVYLMSNPRLSQSRVQSPKSKVTDNSSGTIAKDSGLWTQDSGLARLNGFDLFVPTNFLTAVADKLVAAVKAVGGRTCGWTAFEIVRIEAGIPRFGADMDETNIPIECGIESRAISYTKGCYIGQEVLNRIHSIGHVNREFCGLRIETKADKLPARGEKLFHEGKEVGYITSTTFSPAFRGVIALGYVRREFNQPGAKFILQGSDGAITEAFVRTSAIP
ncbi:MAG: aminomethyl transferase family protein [Verrucomicrobia bacterium]|nr:aminomethyl transferase family protein [Verrucomicrobiota bacterium]